MDSQEIIKEYVALAIAWGNALSQGDSKIANKLNRKLSKIALTVEKDKSLSKSVFTPLLDHGNLSVRIFAIVEAFRCGICVEKAEQLLKSIVDDPIIDPSVGGVRSMARIILIEWEMDKSERKIYLGEK